MGGNGAQHNTRPTGGDRLINQKKEAQSTGTTKVYHKDPCELKEITITCEHEGEEEHGKPGEGKPGEGKPGEGKPETGGAKRKAEKQPDGTLSLEVCKNGDKEPDEAGDVVKAGPTAGVSLIRGTPLLGDHLTLKAEMDGCCRQHPVWTITEKGGKTETIPQKKVEPDHKFVGSQYPLRRGVLGIFWLRTVEPHVYQVVCTAHNGSKKALIRAYPTVESKLEIDTREQGGKPGHTHNPGWVEHLDTMRDKVKEAFKILEQWTGKDSVEVEKLFEGSLYLTNYWKENKASNKVDWKGEMGLDMVFLEMGVEIPIPNPAFLASRAIKFVERVSRGQIDFEVGLYFGVEGKFSANPHFEWTNDVVKLTTGDLSAEFTIQLIAKAEIRWRGYVGALKFRIQTIFTFKATPKMTQEPQITLDVVVNWQPLGGRIQVELRRTYMKRTLRHPFRGVKTTKEYDPPDFQVQFFHAREYPVGKFNLLPPPHG